MTKQVVFTKKLAKSGKGYLSWIPKNVVDYLELDEETYANIGLKSLDYSDVILTFTKRVVKSGRGYLIWIPKDVSDFLKLNRNSLCEFNMKTLGKINSNSTENKLSGGVL